MLYAVAKCHNWISNVENNGFIGQIVWISELCDHNGDSVL